MCTPEALAGVGMMQSYLGYRSQQEASENASASASAQMAASAANTQDILNDLTTQQGELNVSVGKQKTLRLLQGLRERAFLRAALAEGVGTDRAIGVAATSESSDMGSIEASRKSAIGQLERQKKAAISGHASIVNQSVAAAEANRAPSPLNALLGIGLAGFSGYMQGETLKAQYETPASSVAPTVAVPGSKTFFNPKLPTMSGGM